LVVAIPTITGYLHEHPRRSKRPKHNGKVDNGILNMVEMAFRAMTHVLARNT
jgi:hypothetical protein